SPRTPVVDASAVPPKRRTKRTIRTNQVEQRRAEEVGQTPMHREDDAELEVLGDEVHVLEVVARSELAPARIPRLEIDVERGSICRPSDQRRGGAAEATKRLTEFRGELVPIELLKVDREAAARRRWSVKDSGRDVIAVRYLFRERPPKPVTPIDV